MPKIVRRGATRATVVAITLSTLLTACASSGEARSAPVAPPAPAPVTRTFDPSQPRRCALLVGINRYDLGYASRPVPVAARWPRLHGTGNDVAAMRGVLEGRFGFSVEVLRDDNATLAGVEAALDRLADCVQGPDDVALFYFSGHGYQLPDQPTVEAGADEADGYDEALVLYDNSGKRDPAYRGYLVDDRMDAVFARVRERTRNIVLITDSCNSGTVHRGGGAGYQRRRGDGPAAPPSAARAGGQDDGAPADDFILLSAVDSDQLAVESTVAGAACADGGETMCAMGWFTRTLVDELRTIPPETSYATLMTRVRARRLAASTEQTPQLYGPSAKRVFTGRWTPPPPPRFAIDAAPRAAIVHLNDGGMLHGLTRDMVLTVLPLDDVGGGAPLARIRLTEVSATDAYGALLPEDQGGIPGQSMAVFDEPRAAVLERGFEANVALRVALAGAPVEGLDRAVRELPFVAMRPGDEASGWDIRVEPGAAVAKCETEGCRQVVAPGIARCSDAQLAESVVLARAGGGLVPIPAGADRAMTDCIALRGERGEPVAPDVVVARVSAALEVEFRRSRLLAIGNRQPESALQVTLSSELKRTTLELTRRRGRVVANEATRGASEPFTPYDPARDSVHACPIDEVGTARCDIFTLAYTNHGSRPVFVTVFSMASSGAISLVERASTAAAPGSKEARVKPGETIFLGRLNPDGTPKGFLVAPPSGPQIWKLIATERYVDFSPLEYSVDGLRLTRSTKGIPANAHPLVSLLSATGVASRGDRDAGVIEIGDEPGEAWGTDTLFMDIWPAEAPAP